MFGSLPQYLVAGLTMGSTYGLTALGFTIIFNTTGIINLAQGEFVMLGGMLSVVFFRLGLPLPLAMAAAVAISTLIGALMHRGVVAPLGKSNPANFIIATIGTSIIMKGAVMLAFGKDSFSLPAFSGTQPIFFMGAAIAPQSLWVLAITLTLLAALKIFFERSIHGKAMLACACQKKASSLVGIPVGHMATLAFALSGFIGAVGGAILTPITLTAFDVGIMLGLKGFAACMLGGMGNPFGSAAGGLILGVVEALGAGYLSSAYKDAMAFIILLALLFLKPSGLFGKGAVDRA